jgi:glycine betaine/proline transport system substrate-binding protein
MWTTSRRTIWRSSPAWKTGDLDVAMEMWETTGRDALWTPPPRPARSRTSARQRHVCHRGVVVPLLHEGDLPGPAELGSAEERGLRRSLRRRPRPLPKGRYLGGPVTWGGFDDERVEALELPFEVVHAGTDAALFAELESRLPARRRRSCCGSTRRTGRRLKYEGEWVEFPAYDTADCYEDPGLGLQSGHGL